MNEWLQRPKFTPILSIRISLLSPPEFCVSATIFLENIQKTQANGRVAERFGQGLVPKDNFPGWSGACQHPRMAGQWVHPWKLVSLLGLLVQGMTLSNSKLLFQKCDVLSA